MFFVEEERNNNVGIQEREWMRNVETVRDGERQ